MRKYDNDVNNVKVRALAYYKNYPLKVTRDKW